MLPYFHSLAFSYGRANTIRMATCGRIFYYYYYDYYDYDYDYDYDYYYYYYYYLFWKRREKVSIFKNIRIRVDGALAIWNSTHTCSISLYHAPFFENMSIAGSYGCVQRVDCRGINRNMCTQGPGAHVRAKFKVTILHPGTFTVPEFSRRYLKGTTIFINV